MLEIAVLASGSGTNLQAILDQQRHDPDFGARVVVVISDRPGVPALGRAGAAGVPFEVIEFGDHSTREAFTKAVCATAEAFGAGAMVMAGFMRILSSEAVERFPSRILNIHPALLPAFPGARAIEDALEYGVKVTGVTVHFVDQDVDHGPVIAQEIVKVDQADTPETLRRRIQEAEHRLYPRVIKAFANGRLRLEGRRVIWS